MVVPSWACERKYLKMVEALENPVSSILSLAYLKRLQSLISNERVALLTFTVLLHTQLIISYTN